MNKGISAIIGTILMVAIVVAVAMAVYIYVNELTKEEKYVEGWVVDAYHIYDAHINKTGKDYMVWNVTLSPNYQDLENGTSYLVLFPKNDTPAPPPEDVKIRIYYKEIKLGDETGLIAYKVKSL